MIIAHATEKPGQVRLEIVRPDKSKHEFLTVETYAEAERIMVKKNREYILEKISNYLKLRHYALKLSNQVYAAGDAAKLLVLIRYHKQAPLNALANVVAQHAGFIEKIIPGKGSDQYIHYQNIIAPILNYCKKNGGAVQS